MARSKSQPIKLDAAESDSQTAANGTDVIEVVDDNGGNEPTGVVDTSAATESVEDLRAQLTAAEERAERESRARITAERQLGNAGNQIADTNLLAMTNAIDSFTEAKKSVTAKLRAAKESGDYDAEIAATDELQQLNLKIGRVTEGKNELERRIEENKERQERMGTDPVEQYIGGAGLNGRAAQWVRNNPDMIATDGKLDTQKLNNLNFAHAKALRDGHVAGTDAYFDAIDEELFGDSAEPAAPPQREARQRPPAAPPSRQTPPAMNGSTNGSLPNGVERLPDGRYRMSADRREAARISGLSDKEYLENVLAIHREGATTH